MRNFAFVFAHIACLSRGLRTQDSLEAMESRRSPNSEHPGRLLGSASSLPSNGQVAFSVLSHGRSASRGNTSPSKTLAQLLLKCVPAAAFNPSGLSTPRPDLILHYITLNMPKIAPRANVRAEDEPQAAFASFVGTLYKAAESTAMMALEAGDRWVSAGWEVKKRKGQILPEIRPNAAKIAAQTKEVLADAEKKSAALVAQNSKPTGMQGMMAAASGLLGGQAETGGSPLVNAQNVTLLQKEFVRFITPRKGKLYRTSKEGEIIFASQEQLGILVAEFSYGKLKQISAAANALARYVRDLEDELETADDSVVKLRKEVSTREKKLAQANSANSALEAELAELSTQLSGLQQKLTEQEAAQAKIEREAELAAEQGAKDNSDTAKENAVRLERELMEAENAATSLSQSKAELEASVSALQKKQQEVDEERLKEAERVRELERLAEEKEAKASEAAKSLADSEARVAALQVELEQLKGASENAGKAATKDAQQLTEKIEAQLADTADNIGRQALSKMTRKQLIAECEERKLPTNTSVPEMRALLRLERKRDGLVSQLEKQGLNQNDARSTLETVSWDLDLAVKKLVSQ